MAVLTPTDTLNLETEAILDPNIQFDAPLAENASNPQHIFLTGSTGLLGCYLLGDLLEQTTATMHCLIRDENPENAKARLIQNLQFYDRWQEGFQARINPVLGDLSLTRLGLPEAEFHRLAGKIDVIYHSGGWVNSIHPYTVLKPTNVSGTQEVIRLATLTQMKPLHFVSSLAVYFTPTYAGSDVVWETDIPKYDPHIRSGYTQSKWVADRLVQQAQSRGLPASIYRPARVTADSKTGKTNNVKDLLNLLIKGCLFLQKFPTLAITIPIVPVDYLSQAIVRLSQREETLGQAFHFINAVPLPWADLLESVRSCGYEFEELAYPAWRNELKQQIELQPDQQFLKILYALIFAPNNLFFDRPRFDRGNIDRGLAGSAVVCPPIDEKLITTYLSYFQQIGFLPPADCVSTLASP